MRKLFSPRFLFASVILIATAFLAVGHFAKASAQTASGSDKPFVIEYYYKTKWGHADEFIALFRKNHYPVLRKQVEMGRLLKVTAVAPVYHTTEDGRWDYRVTIRYKNSTVATTARGKRRNFYRRSEVGMFKFFFWNINGLFRPFIYVQSVVALCIS